MHLDKNHLFRPPDQRPVDGKAGDEAAQRMRDINAAWEILGDPARRAALDRTRAGMAAASPPPPAPGGASPGGTATGGPVSGQGGRVGQPDAGSDGPGPERVSGDRTSGRSSVGGG